MSDSNVPGEGEAKFCRFVMQQRGRPGWEPNQRHCIYTNDADVLLLALALHEPHVDILRQVCIFTSSRLQRRLARPVFLYALQA